MSSPETIADVDLSVTQLQGGRTHQISGDLPESYYPLGLEDWQTEYFCAPGVTVTELNAYLVAHAILPLPQEEGEEHVALQIFCMGWSWAVWGGETTTEDIVIQNSSTFRASMRVRYGAPAPRLSDAFRVAWASHLDDFFAWIWGDTPTSARARALETRQELRRISKRAGFLLHKEDEGVFLELVGLWTGRESSGRQLTCPKLAGLLLTIEATRGMLEVGRSPSVRVVSMQKVLGH